MGSGVPVIFVEIRQAARQRGNESLHRQWLQDDARGKWQDLIWRDSQQATDGLTNAAIGAQLLAGWLAGRKDGGASS